MEAPNFLGNYLLVCGGTADEAGDLPGPSAASPASAAMPPAGVLAAPVFRFQRLPPALARKLIKADAANCGQF